MSLITDAQALVQEYNEKTSDARTLEAFIAQVDDPEQEPDKATALKVVQILGGVPALYTQAGNKLTELETRIAELEV